MMPTDKLTMRSTTLDKNANEKIAAAVMLNRPAMVVASNMDKRTGSMISYLKMGAGSRAPAVLASGLMMTYCQLFCALGGSVAQGRCNCTALRRA